MPIAHALLRTRLGRALTLLAFGAFILIVLGLLGGEILARFMFARETRWWDAEINNPKSMMVRSSDPVLVFEHRKNHRLESEGHTYIINSRGIREESEDLFADKRRIALVGDSVTFGTSLSQHQSPPAQLQQLIDPEVRSTKILNLGTMGRGLEDFPVHLRTYADPYKPNLILYLLNPNDFTRRNSVYEGGDGGLYRMYVRPKWMLRAALRKLVYRTYRQGLVSAPWYAWMFDGNKDDLLPQILVMRDYAVSIGADFRVFLLPTRTIRDPEADQVLRVYAELADFLKANNIRFADANPHFKDHIADWLDIADHNPPVGAAALARVIRETVLSDEPTIAPATPTATTPATSPDAPARP
jgi:lysophospholipase L1-like esterase